MKKLLIDFIRLESRKHCGLKRLACVLLLFPLVLAASGIAPNRVLIISTAKRLLYNNDKRGSGTSNRLFVTTSLIPNKLWQKGNLYFRVPLGYQRTSDSDKGLNRPGENIQTDRTDLIASESRIHHTVSPNLGGNSLAASAILSHVLQHIDAHDYHAAESSLEYENGDQYYDSSDDYEWYTSSRRRPLPQQPPPRTMQIIRKDATSRKPEYYGFTGQRIQFPQGNPLVKSASSASKDDQLLDEGVEEDTPDRFRYAFLLGVIPATLATLLVLGHTPLQLLLVGAYIVTVYLLNFDGPAAAIDGKGEKSEDVDGAWFFQLVQTALDSGSYGNRTDVAATKEDLKRNEGPNIRFLEMIRWLDQSPFAPLLTEKTMELLFRLSNILDIVNDSAYNNDNKK